jgi:small subunit ribosomal protein S20
LRSKIKTLAKRVSAVMSSDSSEAAKKISIEYISCLDKAVKIGVIHRNSASRHKSALAKVTMS